MLRDRKVRLVSYLGLIVLIASVSASAAAISFGLKTTGTTTSGNVVYVTVANGTSSSQVGTVTVSASVNGSVVSAMATVSVAAGKSVVVPVTFSASPTSVISCGIILDNGNPI